MSFDSKVDVERKFTVVLQQLFKTLAFVASSLRTSGFQQAPLPKLIDLAADFAVKHQKPEHQMLALAKFHTEWDKFFSRDFEVVGNLVIDFLSADSPDYCREVATGIFSAQNPDGTTAIDSNSLNFLFRVLEGMVILSIKYIFWEMEPLTVTSDGLHVTYTFAKTLQGLEGLDINSEIKIRNVPGLPQTL